MPKYRKLPKFSDIDIRLMRVFSTVARSGGFVLAELELNKSKSAISTDISNLESRLGIRLCNRGRAGFSLTRQGQATYEAIQAFFEDLDRFHDEVGAITQSISGELSIRYEEDFAVSYHSLIVDALKEFNRENPNVYLSLSGTSSPEVVRAIQTGSADVGITSLRRKISGVTSTALLGEELGLYSSESHPLYAVPDNEISVEDLNEEVFVDLRTRHSEFVANFLDHARIVARAPTMQGRTLLIKTGQFLGFLPTRFVNQNNTNDLSREIRPDLFRQTSTGFLIVRNNPDIEQKTEEFCKIVVRIFNKAAKNGQVLNPPS